MILLDTNVITEAMRPSPTPGVIRWLDSLSERDVWVSAITVAEIRLGITLLPEGRRRALLFEMAEQMFEKDFSGQCLPFDCEAAQDYALIVAERTRQGRPVSVEDAQIAAIARVGGSGVYPCHPEKIRRTSFSPSDCRKYYDSVLLIKDH